MESNNEKRRYKRLYEKIKTLLNQYKGKCIFLTMSFNDSILQSTNETTRERYIKQFLKEETAIYIANKDYGKKRKREHYHAFIIACTLNDKDIKKELRPNKNKVNLKAYRYGQINAQIIAINYRPKNDEQFNKTTENLTNHFFKETTLNSRIITSRKEPNKKQQLKRLRKLNKTLINESL